MRPKDELVVRLLFFFLGSLFIAMSIWFRFDP